MSATAENRNFFPQFGNTLKMLVDNIEYGNPRTAYVHEVPPEPMGSVGVPIKTSYGNEKTQRISPDEAL